MLLTLCRLYAIVIYVLHFCFELRSLKMTSKIKLMRAPLFNEWDLTNFSHTEYASLFMFQLYRLSAQNAPSAQCERVCPALNELLLWMRSSSGGQ